MLEQAKIPEAIPSCTPNNLQAGAYYPPIPPKQEFEQETPSIPLSHYLWILRRHSWKIAAFIAACVLATAVVSARLKPIYEAIATIDIDMEAPSNLVGQGSTRPVGFSFDSDEVIATQVKLIQSDAVLRPVAEQFHLLGNGGEQKNLNAEKAQEIARAPVGLGGLKVVRLPNTYLLLISYRSPDPRLAADVANAVANSYLASTYNIRIMSSATLSSFMEKQLDELKAKMEKSGLALAQFEKDLNVINPEEKTNVLSARLLQLNSEYTTAKVDRVRKEAAMDAVQSGSLEAAQASSQGGGLATLSENLNQAHQRLALSETIYGTAHPEYRKAASVLAEVEKEIDSARSNIAKRSAVEYRESLNREQMLQKAVAETKAESDLINSRSFEYQQLKREADADKALYDELIRKIRESDINAGFKNNNIRVADVARPPLGSVYPNVKLNLILMFFFSTLFAVSVALLQDRLDTTLRDPKEASRFLGTDVIGTMPMDRLAAELSKSAVVLPSETSADKIATSGSRKGYYSTTSDFEEAARTLRNTILLADFERRLRSIMVTSATPGEGKSTIAAHLAMANSDSGKKTLLVDGDLRRPSLHAKFGMSPREGLSNVLTGELSWHDVVLPVEGRPNLSLLPAGPGSHRVADLMGSRIAILLDEFAKEYELVILDSPPLLGFSECLQMATDADGVLIISRAGETKRHAVAEVISVLSRIHANIVGVVLNQVSQNTSGGEYSCYSGYRYGQYQKSE